MCAVFSSLKYKLLNLESPALRKEDNAEISGSLVDCQAKTLRLGLARLETISEQELLLFYSTLEGVVLYCATCSEKLHQWENSADFDMIQGNQAPGISSALLWLYFVYHSQHPPTPILRDLTPQAEMPESCDRESSDSPSSASTPGTCSSEVPLCGPQKERGLKSYFSLRKKTAESSSLDSSIFDQPYQPSSSNSSLSSEETTDSEMSRRKRIKNYINKTVSHVTQKNANKIHESLRTDIKIIKSFGLVRFFRRDVVVKFFRSLDAKNLNFTPLVYSSIWKECQNQDITASDLKTEVYYVFFKKNWDVTEVSGKTFKVIYDLVPSPLFPSCVDEDCWRHHFPEHMSNDPDFVMPVPTLYPESALAPGYRPMALEEFLAFNEKCRKLGVNPFNTPAGEARLTALSASVKSGPSIVYCKKSICCFFRGEIH